ncbi:MAG: PAS domain-containing protein, partial [Gemmatimonadaceae bacterium]
MLRWIYMGRLAMSAAIFLAAVFAWRDAERADTLVASLLMTGTMIFTAGSAAYSEIARRPIGEAFYYFQAVFDLILVTAIVHVTGGGTSQFAALYILVIAASALLLDTQGAILMGAFGCTLYFAEVIVFASAPANVGLWLQLAVFATVALSSGFIAARLREAGAGTKELAAELVKVRLQASDILRNISSGIVTVDAKGILLFANPKASALLSLPLESLVGKPVLSTLEPVSPVLARALERAVADGVRTHRAEGSVQAKGRVFPIGLNTTVSTPNDDTGGSHATEGATSATAIFQDITDQKRLDTLHLRAERLEAVAELSASLAHEIKNPLASIRSAVEQLGRGQRATPDEQSLAS